MVGSQTIDENSMALWLGAKYGDKVVWQYGWEPNKEVK